MALKALAPLALACFTAGASADFIGFYGGATYWSPSLEGEFRSDGSTQGMIDVEKDLGHSSDSTTTFYLAFEHPIPLVPNVRVEHTPLSSSGSNQLNRTLEFNGTTFVQDSNVESEFDLTHTDWTAYYELLDDTFWLSFDAGATLRVFDGRVRLNSENVSLHFMTPMLYGKADIFIPGTDFSVGAMFNYLDIDEVSVVDRRAYIAYESPFRVGAEIGYRAFDVELDDIDNIDGDLSLEGFYGSVTLHL